MKQTAELILDAKASLGEGVCWDAEKNVLYWVDILKKEVHIFDPRKSRDYIIRLDQYIGAVVPTSDSKLLLAVQHGFFMFAPDTEKFIPVYNPEKHLEHNRFNDGKCDPCGRFWAGTMDLNANKPAGALYRLDKDFSVHKMVDKVTVSNGLAWSCDHKTMYYIDTALYEISAFDYDLESGGIANRRTAVRFAHSAGHPDGMTIDEEGMLWVAFCGGGRVRRFNPGRQRLLQEIELPVSLVTNCVFGGPDLDTLYISSARVTLDEAKLRKQPLAGGIFAVKPGVRGLVPSPFNIQGKIKYEDEK